MSDFKLRQIIKKKRDGLTLGADDIAYFVEAVKMSIQTGTHQIGVADRCQIGAMLMAIYLNGLDDFETNQLTLRMRDSGHTFHWPQHQKDRIVDKHSTGGVGDKTSLILVPALAVCDLLIPMISGRSLGHTGGTLDKLEAIEGFVSSQTNSEIMKAVDTIGCCIAGQTSDCVPADKVLYECRDLTSTVDSPPLIIASIVSKKLCENPSALVYDVKFGRGSIFKSEDEALEAARGLITASKPVRAVALLTSMDAPLGRAIGDSLETLEALECLKGKGPKDVGQLVEALGGELLRLTNTGDERDIANALKNGTALKKFHDMLILQRTDKETAFNLCYGDASEVFKNKALHSTDCVYSGEKGFISSIDPLILGNMWKEEYSSSSNNPGVGFYILKTVGDHIKSGDVWIKFHHQCEEISREQRMLISEAIQVSQEPVERKLIKKRLYYEGDSLLVVDY